MGCRGELRWEGTCRCVCRGDRTLGVLDQDPWADWPISGREGVDETEPAQTFATVRLEIQIPRSEQSVPKAETDSRPSLYINCTLVSRRLPVTPRPVRPSSVAAALDAAHCPPCPRTQPSRTPRAPPPARLSRQTNSSRSRVCRAPSPPSRKPRALTVSHCTRAPCRHSAPPRARPSSKRCSQKPPLRHILHLPTRCFRRRRSIRPTRRR